MKLIVGLGNPGEKYQSTRHNTGFLTLDILAEELKVNISRKAFNALIGKTIIQGEQVILMKPQTYMNNSGEAVGKAVRYYHLDPARDVLIIYDDLDLPVGRFRLREKGSAGGHNGIKSIIAHLNTNVFNRIRVGIGSDDKGDTIDYVLGNFHGEERQLFNDSIKLAAAAARESLYQPFQKVMNKYNQLGK